MNNSLTRRSLIVFMALNLLLAVAVTAQTNVESAYALIKRTVPSHAAKFKVEALPKADSLDAFEIESNGKHIVLRGNNGVAIASALYYYLKEVAGGQITWNGSNLKLPDHLPKVPSVIRKSSAYQYRYYLNYCTFNYSMSWWDWQRWEKEIDWMALHGINMPLAITGQEFVWYEVYKDLGFTDEDLKEYFSGPAYFAWFWMGNLDRWGGPLPYSWMASHRVLQQKILARQRSLGMTPVLPAFTGHVPKSFSKHFPKAKLKATNWTNGFEDTYILDAEDSLFSIIGKKFLEKQTELFGTDHLYSADTFNENEPPSDDPEYLAGLSKKIYEGMHAVDPKATWVMQGWLFYSDREFWHDKQIKALLDAVPNERMIILDLAAEIEPVWKRTNAFYGKPWIWNMLHNFGGNISMFGRMDGVAQGPPLALRNESSGRMKGIGLTMEAIEQNPVLYELMTDHTWRTESIDLDEWLKSYAKQRYGVRSEHAEKAWTVLRNTVYNGKDIRDGAESILVARPTLENERRWAKTRLNYEPKQLLSAWNELILAVPECKSSEGFKYDLVDVTRQVLANYALLIHQKNVVAFQQKDTERLQKHAAQFISLLDDLDGLLKTRQDFLLGRWIADARKCGGTPDEKALYERNARNLITLWGGEANKLHEYSNRQWSGLISDFYKPRWQMFFSSLQTSLINGVPFNQSVFDETCRRWEWDWVNQQSDFPVNPSGGAIEAALTIHKKYYELMLNSYSEQ